MRVVTLIALALLLACSKKESATEPQPEPAEAVETETAETEVLPDELTGPAPPVDAAPRVKLAKPGQERSELRLSIAPGTKQKLTMQVHYLARASVGGTFPVQSPLQLAKYVLLLEAAEKTPEGAVTVRFTVADIDLVQDAAGKSKERAERTKATKKAMKAVRGLYTLPPAGGVSAIELDVPKNATRLAHALADNLRWSLLALMPPLPQEPVGIGGSWTAHRGVDLGGQHINELTTHRLVERDGDQVRIESVPQQTAEGQDFRNPGSMPELELIEFENEASQEVTWNLTKPAPDAATVRSLISAVVQIKNRPDKNAMATLIRAERIVTVPAS
jgi:hypothetical protein